MSSWPNHLDNPYFFAIFVAEKLYDIGAILNFTVGEFCPMDAIIVVYAGIHLCFNVINLLLRECRSVEVES